MTSVPKSIGIRQVVFSTFAILLVLYTIACSVVISSVTSTERDKLRAIAAPVSRAISNDLLFNDKISLEHTLNRLHSVYNLEQIDVSEERLSCRFPAVSCILDELNVLEPPYHIRIIGKTSIPTAALWSIFTVISSSILLFLGIGYILFSGVKRPLETISSELFPELVEFIKSGHPIKMRDFSTVKEISDIAENITAMASTLRVINERNKDIEVKLRVNDSIARTTQALAHDVRKPFSMFKSIIQVVEATEDPSEVKEVLKLTLPEVNQAMASVEGMIQDVMQMGSDAKMNMEDAAPDSLVEAAVGEVFRVYPEADVTISYEFAHRHMVKADSVRLGRVFANILGNAVQAMREKGNLWIRTCEREGFVEFTLGNGGSVIPAESLPKLFDAFFTSGKKGGTGLGLAIAKKIVEAHGGTIRCVSEENDKYPSGMVELYFTLPVSDLICSPRTDALPRYSREIQAALAAVRIAASRQGNAGPDPREVEIEAAILARLEAMRPALRRDVTVLVVEDEAVYRNGLLSLLEQSEALAARVRMVFAKNDEEALAAASASQPVLLIEDVDLGPRSKDGLEIVKTLRKEGFSGHICVHSNRFLLGDSRAALAAGADAVLPKPMGRAHFLKLLLASIPEPPIVESDAKEEQDRPMKLSVAMVDDSASQRMAWKSRLKEGTQFRAFADSGTLLNLFESEPSYFPSLDVVVTDFNFASGDPHDGGTLARELRKRGYRGLILRASGESDLGPEIEALFDGDVGKSALEFSAFQEAVERARRNQKHG